MDCVYKCMQVVGVNSVDKKHRFEPVPDLRPKATPTAGSPRIEHSTREGKVQVELATPCSSTPNGSTTAADDRSRAWSRPSSTRSSTPQNGVMLERDQGNPRDLT